MVRSNNINRVLVIVIAIIVGMSMLMGSSVKVNASTKPSKVVISSAVSLDYNKIELRWKSAKYAKKYEVWRSEAYCKYKKIGTYETKRITDSGLKTNVQYRYIVRGVGKDGTKGSFSETAFVVPVLEAPRLNLKDAGKTSISLKMSGKSAQGYIVYKKNSKGSYVKLATVSKSYYTDKNLSRKTKYAYKCKAFRKVGSGYVYSDLSNVLFTITK